MKFPDSITNLVSDMSARYNEDIPKAIAKTMERVLALPETRPLFETWVLETVTSMIYQERHKRAVAMRKALGDYGRPGRINPATSEAVNAACRFGYTYPFAGITLGSVSGDMLPGIRDLEMSKASTHLFHVRMCDWLQAKGVVGEKTVKEMIPEDRLRKACERLWRQSNEDAA